MPGYPNWIYFPRRQSPPGWVEPLITVVRDCQAEISTIDRSNAANAQRTTSNVVLRALSPGLVGAGYTVELSRARVDQIARPVLFGDEGRPTLTYRVDAFHARNKVLVEIEAGRGAVSNAVYRNLIEASLIFDATYLVLVVAQRYTYSAQRTVQSYADTRGLLSAIYGSGRLQLPLDGVLVISY